MVNTFHKLARLGPGASLRIKAESSCPWNITFTKWCLGIPPHIVLEAGTILLNESSSKVLLLVGSSSTVNVEVFHDIDSVSQLWLDVQSLTTDNRWSGMLSVQKFGSRRLGELGLQTEFGNRALRQAFYYSLKAVKDRLLVSPGGIYGRAALRDQLRRRSFKLFYLDYGHLTKIYVQHFRLS